MSTQTQNPTTETTTRHYKKTVLEMFIDATDKVCNSKKSAQQLSASGNEFHGLNNNLLATEKADKGYKSNEWFSEKQMAEAGLTQKQGEDFGVAIFTTKLIDVEGTNKKEKVLRYWLVFNKDQLEAIPV